MISPLNELRQKITLALYRRDLAACHALDRARTTRASMMWTGSAAPACSCAARMPNRLACSTSGTFSTRKTSISAQRSARRAGASSSRRRPRSSISADGRGRPRRPAAMHIAYRRSHLAFYEKHHPGWAPAAAALSAHEGTAPAVESRVLRIAIDARKMRDYGIGTYRPQSVATPVAARFTQTEYVLFCRADDSGAVEELGDNFRAIPDGAKPYSVGEQLRIPLDLRREEIDLFHAPHYVLPPLTPCKSVVTIHDCIHLRFPQYLPNRIGYAYARSSMWVATHRANRVLTVSEASKRDILRYLQHPGATNRGHLQRDRRSARAKRRRPTTSNACAIAIS